LKPTFTDITFPFQYGDLLQNIITYSEIQQWEDTALTYLLQMMAYAKLCLWQHDSVTEALSVDTVYGRLVLHC
jgi:hypothetical protein